MDVYVCNHVLGRSGEVGVVGTRAVLNTHDNAVVARAALTKVVVLEIERFLGETVAVGEVVEDVDHVERIGASSIDVRSDGRTDGGVVGVVEDARSGLGGNACLAAFECYDVVSAVEGW